jgi:hypothetical protein
MRNAILRADLVRDNGQHRSAIWHVFSHRGMGFFAGSVDSADANPKSDFHMPPAATHPHDGTVAGIVTDPTTGDPVGGAVVQVTGQGDQYSATTAANGFYEIDGLVTGTYKKVVATAPGYFGSAHKGTAVSFNKFQVPGDFTNFHIIRDWAATSGGAAVDSFNGPDYSQFGCGPDGAFDTSLTTGWGSTTGDDQGDPTNTFIDKFVVVKLPQPVDITEFRIDPSATCGDGLSASTGNVTVAVSTTGVTFNNVATASFTNADDGHLNTVTPSSPANGIQYVKLTIHSNQTPSFATNCPNGPYSGCAFTDLTELAVLGTASP